MFYAWQHGMGCMKKLPKEQELLQMPGRGELDFRPLLRPCAISNTPGGPRSSCIPCRAGIPILDTTDAVTDEINRARDYLEKQLRSL